jgi:hypothetical protein
MENVKKVTKKEYYGMLKEIVENSNVEGQAELVEFIDKQIELLENKAAKAKEKAAEKRAEGDELRATVEAALTEEYQTIADITAQIDDEEVTKAKVTARLTQLVKDGIAVKEEAKTEDNKKIMVYKRA